MLCQFTAPDGESTLADFVDQPGVYPAGRLDKDSEGLLILTSDGALQERISHPRHKLPKTYHVQVQGVPAKPALDKLRRGIMLKDGQAKAAEVVVLAGKPPYLWPRTPPISPRKGQTVSWLSITIKEGRNRQVRRMTAAAGLPTLRLIRYEIGPVKLDNPRLMPGQWRWLEKDVWA